MVTKMRQVDEDDDAVFLGFLESIDAIFDEAVEKGYDLNKEFVFIRRIIIDFLHGCSKSVVKARANLSVTFSDFKRPQTPIGYPPSRLELSPEQSQNLKASTSRHDFIACLKQLVESRSDRSCGRKRRNTPAKDQGGPRKKQKTMPQVQKPSYHDTNGSSIGQQHTRQEGQEQQSRRRIIVHRPLRHLKQPESGIIQVANCTELPNVCAPSDVADGESWKPDQSQIFDEVKKEPKYDSAPEPESPIGPISTGDDLAPQIDTIGAETEELKPRPSSDVDDMKGDSRSAPSTAGSNNDDVSWSAHVLASATRLQAEITTIPPANWASYALAIRALCDSDEIKAMDFERRLRRIKGLLYVKEEEEAVVSGDWDRMRGVARLCAFIAEITAPDCEDVDHAKTDKWLATQLKDIRFLEKSLLTKKRIMALQV